MNPVTIINLTGFIFAFFALIYHVSMAIVGDEKGEMYHKNWAQLCIVVLLVCYLLLKFFSGLF